MMNSEQQIQLQRYALLGWPVKHSVSPEMQCAAFQACGIRASYELISVEPVHLEETVSRLREQSYCGWNVTVPHKEKVLNFLDRVDEDAVASGSVNTILNKNGRLHGFSTDGYGMAAALSESFGVRVRNGKFAFIGAGGAARAVSVYFARHGAAEIMFVNRTLEKAEKIASRIETEARNCRVQCFSRDNKDSIRACFLEADAIIQATSLGLHQDDVLPVAPELLPGGVPVMDMIYRPTPLLGAAQSKGCPTADGRSMLLHQGARSFELWTKRQAPVEIMRKALEQALKDRN